MIYSSVKILNLVLQIYKFCQCKNGTHKINSKTNATSDDEDSYSFTVNCNTKKVSQANGNMDKDEPALTVRLDEEKKEIDKHLGDKKENDNTKTSNNDSIWSIFGINNSQPSGPKASTCIILFELVLFFFYLFKI